jgi:hypothetical protein
MDAYLMGLSSRARPLSSPRERPPPDPAMGGGGFTMEPGNPALDRYVLELDGEAHRRPRYREAVAAGEVPGGFGVDDGVGLLFAGRELAEAVSSRPRARAYRIERGEPDGVVETALTPLRLPAPERAGVSPEVSELRRTSLARRHAVARGRSGRLRP